MTVPLIALAQVRILQEELIEASEAPDPVPDDLAPATRFDKSTVHARLPEPAGFSVHDLRLFARWHAKPRRTVVVCGEGTAVINRDAKDVLEFVLDVHQYRRADRKVGKVHWIRRDGNSGQVRHGARLLGLPAPAVTLAFELTPYSRLDFKGQAVPWPMRGFEGSFTCTQTPQGTQVTHRECFAFGPIIGSGFKLALGGWLSRDTPAEIMRMKHLLETGPAGTPRHR